MAKVGPEKLWCLEVLKIPVYGQGWKELFSFRRLFKGSHLRQRMYNIGGIFISTYFLINV